MHVTLNVSRCNALRRVDQDAAARIWCSKVHAFMPRCVEISSVSERTSPTATHLPRCERLLLQQAGQWRAHALLMLASVADALIPAAAGEQPHSGIIAGITPSGANTIVTCVEEERLGFEEGHLVTFSEVAGMEPLNTAPPARIRSKTTYSIEIELDTSQFPGYTTGPPRLTATCHAPPRLPLCVHM